MKSKSDRGRCGKEKLRAQPNQAGKDLFEGIRQEPTYANRNKKAAMSSKQTDYRIEGERKKRIVRNGAGNINQDAQNIATERDATVSHFLTTTTLQHDTTITALFLEYTFLVVSFLAKRFQVLIHPPMYDELVMFHQASKKPMANTPSTPLYLVLPSSITKSGTPTPVIVGTSLAA